jgi:hypothetical protein
MLMALLPVAAPAPPALLIEIPGIELVPELLELAAVDAD